MKRSTTKTPIGYQVTNSKGENWADRPSFEILDNETAGADLKEAQKTGQQDWQLIPIHEGDIESPSFY